MRRRRRHRHLSIGAAVVVALALASTAAFAGTHPRRKGGRTISGTVEILQPSFETAGTPCTADVLPEFDDLHRGTPVRVTNAAGKRLASGALGVGRYRQASTGFAAGAASSDVVDCFFAFEVKHVPGAATYRITVDGRELAKYERALLELAEWTVKLTVAPAPEVEPSR